MSETVTGYIDHIKRYKRRGRTDLCGQFPDNYTGSHN